jgi:hypothetical protein
VTNLYIDIPKIVIEDDEFGLVSILGHEIARETLTKKVKKIKLIVDVEVIICIVKQSYYIIFSGKAEQRRNVEIGRKWSCHITY